MDGWKDGIYAGKGRENEYASEREGEWDRRTGDGKDGRGRVNSNEKGEGVKQQKEGKEEEIKTGEGRCESAA